MCFFSCRKIFKKIKRKLRDNNNNNNNNNFICTFRRNGFKYKVQVTEMNERREDGKRWKWITILKNFVMKSTGEML